MLVLDNHNKACYVELMKNSTCHPDRPLYAVGLCRPCYSKEHYRKTHEYHLLRLRWNKIRLLNEQGGKCVDCGFRGHPAALDFYHIDPKEKSFTIGTSLGIRWLDLLTEAKKCVVRCANCERIRTHAYSRKEIEAFEPVEARYCLFCTKLLTGRSDKYCDDKCGSAYRQAEYRKRRAL